MKRLATLLLPVTLLAGCGSFESNAATVNGQAIPDEVLVRQVSAIEERASKDPNLTGPTGRLATKQIASNVLTELILSKATQAEFDKRKLKTTVDQQNRAKAAVLEIYGDALDSLPQELRGSITKRLAQAEALREAGVITADYRCLRALSFVTEEEAKAKRAEIVAGAQFLTLVKQQGQHDDGNDGRAGCFQAADFAQLDPVTRSNLESLTIGQTSQPVDNGQGWVLLYSAAEFSEPFLKPKVTVNPRYGHFVSGASTRTTSSFNVVGFVQPPEAPKTSTTAGPAGSIQLQPGAAAPAEQ